MRIPNRFTLLYGALFLTLIYASVWWFAVDAPRRTQEREAEEFKTRQTEIIRTINLWRIDQADNRRKANISRIESRAREARREFLKDCQELQRTWERDLIREIPHIQPDYRETLNPLQPDNISHSGPNRHYFYLIERTPKTVLRDLENEFDDIIMENASAPPP